MEELGWGRTRPITEVPTPVRRSTGPSADALVHRRPPRPLPGDWRRRWPSPWLAGELRAKPFPPVTGSGASPATTRSGTNRKAATSFQRPPRWSRPLGHWRYHFPGRVLGACPARPLCAITNPHAESLCAARGPDHQVFRRHLAAGLESVMAQQPQPHGAHPRMTSAWNCAWPIAPAHPLPAAGAVLAAGLDGLGAAARSWPPANATPNLLHRTRLRGYDSAPAWPSQESPWAAFAQTRCCGQGPCGTLLPGLRSLRRQHGLKARQQRTAFEGAARKKNWLEGVAKKQAPVNSRTEIPGVKNDGAYLVHAATVSSLPAPDLRAGRRCGGAARGWTAPGAAAAVIGSLAPERLRPWRRRKESKGQR